MSDTPDTSWPEDPAAASGTGPDDQLIVSEASAQQREEGELAAAAAARPSEPDSDDE